MPERNFFVVDGADPARWKGSLSSDVADLLVVFASAAGKHGFDGDDTPVTAPDAISRLHALPSGQEVLILFLASAPVEIRLVPGFLRAIAGMGHSLALSIVLCSFQTSTSNALDCAIAGAGAVIDWVTEPGEFEEMVRCAAAGSPLFPAFRPPSHLSALRKAFIITPYVAPGRPGVSDDIYGGMLPALKALRIEPVLAKDHIVNKNLQHGIREHIESADFSIVNVSTYGGSPNANVYWEYGFAEGSGKTVIVVNDLAYVPHADFAGIVQARYKTPAHLTQILYFGLKHLA